MDMHPPIVDSNVVFKLNAECEDFEGINVPIQEPLHVFLNTSRVLLFIDKQHSRIWMWIGRAASFQEKLIGNRLIPIINQKWGLSNAVIAIDEGEEPLEFKLLVGLIQTPAVVENNGLRSDSYNDNKSAMESDIRKKQMVSPEECLEPGLTPHNESIHKSPDSDNVSFSIYAPTTIAPGKNFDLFVWAYKLYQRAEVAELAGFHGKYEEVNPPKGPIPLIKGDLLQVHLKLPPPFKIEDEFDSIMWLGERTNATFSATTPLDIEIGEYPGSVEIYLRSVRVLRINFTIEIGNANNRPIDKSRQAKSYRTAFASYAHEDGSDVLQTVQGIAINKVDVFVDHLSIPAGALWEQTIFTEIETRDQFLLFWSTHARKSEWVEKEWRYALKTRGLGIIQPIPLESPDIAPPPLELASLQFEDKYRIYRKAFQSSRSKLSRHG